MALVTVEVTTKKVALNPGDTVGKFRFRLESEDGSSNETDSDVPRMQFPNVRAGTHTIFVSRLDQQGIALADPISQEFTVSLDEVATYDAPAGMTITVARE